MKEHTHMHSQRSTGFALRVRSSRVLTCSHVFSQGCLGKVECCCTLVLQFLDCDMLAMIDGEVSVSSVHRRVVFKGRPLVYV